MSGDGLALLSRKDLSMQEWEAKGLLAPAPHYCDHFYDSLRCIPSGIEEKIYANRGKPLHYLELKSALQYEPAMGFRVAIDALYNVKTKGFPIFKVLFSVYPPGAFYQPTRLTGDVFFTTSMDWTSAQISPEFGDGYTTLWGSPSDRLLAVIFDVQTISRHSKTGAITLQQYGWTFLPVLANSRSVDTCSIQLPLFQGDVNLDVLKTATDGLSALVNNVGNYKIPHLSTQPIVNATLSKMIPSQLSVKYNYDGIRIAALKKKAPLSKLLPTSIPKAQFEKDLNQAFANNMGIRHLLF
ncbi:hypothetical protein PHYBOEH_002292 [Phytophthora boehmeriae]|uniref:Uncharacterized protein n=1 Tax=Phytophthora boehmeriae TaxID=109152 RepID=A0A8T1WUQ3_9STRA|nr:hypothetical protein PHYBOEH_002292 [Phytophthora boehmeriae]